MDELLGLGQQEAIVKAYKCLRLALSGIVACFPAAKKCREIAIAALAKAKAELEKK